VHGAGKETQCKGEELDAFLRHAFGFLPCRCRAATRVRVVVQKKLFEEKVVPGVPSKMCRLSAEDEFPSDDTSERVN
jgi:hypothetical protein